jgi:hypothetical protein
MRRLPTTHTGRDAGVTVCSTGWGPFIPAIVAVDVEGSIARNATSTTLSAAGARVPRLSQRDTAGVLGEVLAPLVARGIARRPWIVRLEDRMDADRRAVHRMQLVRDRYGPGPVLLAIPGRNVAMVLSGDHVTRVLEGSP